MDRVNSTIQISTGGIAPGGGVGNKRKALDKSYLGVDVIAIGVPTVVDAATLTIDVLDLANLLYIFLLLSFNPLNPSWMKGSI